MSEEKQKSRITSVTIENFKGIGAPVTIPLKPITLFFGANSAGKSTVMQALLLMNDWLKRLGPDLDTLSLGGDKIHLGGFKQFVHRHDESKKVRIRVECSLKGQKLPCFPEVFNPPSQEELDRVDINKHTDIYSCFVEILFGRHFETDKPDILAYTVGLNGNWVVSHRSDSIHFNASSSIVETIVGEDDALKKAVLLSDIAGTSFISIFQFERDNESVVESCVPLEWTTPYDLLFEDDSFYDDYYEDYPDEFQKAGFDRGDGMPDADLEPLAHLASQMLLGVGRIVSETLPGHIHIGPLRIVPKNGRVEEWGKTCWFDGSQAWIEILKPRWTEAGFLKRHKDKPNEEIDKIIDRFCWYSKEPELDEYGKFCEQVNVFLVVVGAGYTVKCKSTQLLDINGPCLQRLKRLYGKQSAKLTATQIADILSEIKKAPAEREVVFLDGNNTELRPIDLGSGVSQMIPILIGAVVGGGVLSIEEPELHLHPAMQCNLADVFIIRANWGRVSILETHSEHLILRLLRRMRETAAGKEILELTPDNVAVLAFEAGENGTEVQEMEISEAGELLTPWPNGFFPERMNEILGE